MENELTLLQAARSMDRDALVRIFDEYSAPLHKFVLRLSGDSMLADQIVGDVFAKLLEQIVAGNGPNSNLRAYLYKAAYYCLLDVTKYSKRRIRLETLDWHPSVRNFESQSWEDRILFEQVIDAVQHELTADQRHVIVLRFIEELSLRETAAILRKPVGYVKVIQGRALAKLRQTLEEKNIRKTIPSLKIQFTQALRP